MEEAAAKPKTVARRRRVAKKADVAAAGPAAGEAAAAARPAATDATAGGTAGGTEQTEAEDAGQPKPSLSQRLVQSLKQLSNVGAVSKTEEANEVDQRQQGVATEPAPPEEAEQERQWGMERSGEAEDEGERDGAEEEGEGTAGVAATARKLLRRRARSAAALGRRALAAGARRLPDKAALNPPALAALALLALALVGGMHAASQARAGRRQLAALERQVSSQAASAAAARAKLARQLSEVQLSLDSLSKRQVASASGLEALQRSCSTQAGTAAGLAADLTRAQTDIAALQAALATAAAAAAAAAADKRVAEGLTKAAEPGPAAAGASLDYDKFGSVGSELASSEARMRQLAREEAGAELDLFSADRTGLPDWALAAGGASVVAHSPAHMPPPASSRLSALKEVLGGGEGGTTGGATAGKGVHPQANRLILSPISQPGSCLPLVGTSGWVDIRLSRPIHPTAATYEHIPASIAYDIRTAPHVITLLGYLGKPPLPAQEGASSASAGAHRAAGQAGSSEQDAGTGSAAAGGAGSGGDVSGAGAADADVKAQSQGVLLGSFAYDIASRRAVQTFPLVSTPDATHADVSPEATVPAQRLPAQQPLVDHVRLLVSSNHGHPGYTCLYRLRVHGTPAPHEA